jgi:hypothetical protein
MRKIYCPNYLYIQKSDLADLIKEARMSREYAHRIVQTLRQKLKKHDAIVIWRVLNVTYCLLDYVDKAYALKICDEILDSHYGIVNSSVMSSCLEVARIIYNQI